MKAVIYARYSSDNQREESIEGQIRECTAYCERNGITVLRSYIDRAMSARTDKRPDLSSGSWTAFPGTVTTAPSIKPC